MQVRVATPPKIVSNSACPTCRAVTIHMEFPGKALVSVEGIPNAESLRVILECLLR